PDSVAVAAHLHPSMTAGLAGDGRPVSRPGRVFGAHRLGPELECGVEGVDRVADPVGGNDATDLDRRGRDYFDVYPVLAQHLEDLGGDPWVRAHPGPDDRDLADPVVGSHLERGAVELFDHVGGGGQVGAIDGEGEVGELVVADRLVLDDHVDVDAGAGE